MEKGTEKNLSRRSFLKGAGVVTVGAVAAGGFMSLVKPRTAGAAFTAWPYAPLDVEDIRQRAFYAYFGSNCCYGVAQAFCQALYQAVGTPWDTIPLEMFKYGQAGALKWGTLCGAINGALPIMNLIVPSKMSTIGHELIGWYTTNAFPSVAMDGYTPPSGFTTIFPGQVKSVSDSPLCHQSLTRWCGAAGVKVNSLERKMRCGKLTGDVAAKMAELLNENYYNTFVADYQPASTFAPCLGCHYGATSQEDDVVEQADCLPCHNGHKRNPR